MNNTVANIKAWFTEAIPEPTDKNRAVQIGVHFEEVAEMLDAVYGKPYDPTLCRALHALANTFKKHITVAPDAVDRNALLDAMADQIVTAIGVAHMFNLDIEGALAEVNRSNWSKFVDGKPVFDANGKIAKPATYSPPDLTPYV